MAADLLTEIVSPDRRLTALAAGPEEGPPVLFLHGVGGGARLWSRQLRDLGARGYRAIALNLPGHGGSAPVEPASVGLYGDILAGFISMTALAPPVLVGHSLGGMVVQSYLADGLGLSRGVVLAHTSPSFGGRDAAWAGAFVETRLQPLDRGETMAQVAEWSVPAMMGRDPPPEGVALARRLMAETPPATYRDSLLSMIGFDRRSALARIGVPALLVAGVLDEMAPAATMEKMAQKIAGSEFLCLEGVGHFAMLERPEAFEAAIAGFLARVVPVG
ncbi:alpha/beta hydrolase [Enterovirga sp.]|uniref:alpha/beta fold hydrolase n=1 Tax=Enterovirga sp. TaxID=2026350 RepID=UPI002C915269|nr:alpha/beta hydrolase [Enterovirga sp.]HMO28607.1 alpha/beta hydrolase [Enterovirga sp.]